MTAPLVLINAVGLTPRLLPHADRLAKLAARCWAVPMRDVVPAVTMSAQATMLTGQPIEKHGIVGNGWLFRDTNEIRFWQQSNRLMQAEPLYATARRRAKERERSFPCAKLFWWFNQGADVDISRHAQAALRDRRQQGLRHHRHARRLQRRAGTATRPVSVPHVLGADGRPAMYAVDRTLRRRGREREAARPDARLSAAPRLRPAAIRPVRLRHAEARRVNSTTPARRCSTPRRRAARGSGS